MTDLVRNCVCPHLSSATHPQQFGCPAIKGALSHRMSTGKTPFDKMSSTTNILFSSSICLGLMLFLVTVSGQMFPPGPPGPGPHGRGPPLPFLRNVSREQVREFFQIASNSNETKAEIKSGLQSWAQSAGVSAAYANFTSQCQQRAEQFHDNVTANLAGQALQLFNQLWSISQDDSITRVAECQQIRAAMMNGTTSPVVRRLVPVPHSTIPGPPPRECRPHPRPFPPPLASRFGPPSHENDDGSDGSDNDVADQ